MLAPDERERLTIMLDRCHAAGAREALDDDLLQLNASQHFMHDLSS